MDSPNTLTAERELWAVALFVEQRYGTDGPDHIAEQVTQLAEEGDFDGVAMWLQVAERFDMLVSRPTASS